jgi:hypothetical protein
MWDQNKVAMLSSKESFVEHLKRYAYFGKNEKVEIFLPATATIEELSQVHKYSKKNQISSVSANYEGERLMKIVLEKDYVNELNK